MDATIHELAMLLTLLGRT